MTRNVTGRLHARLCAGVLAAIVATVLVPATAHAQTNPPPLTTGEGFDFRLFRPAVDSKGQFSVNGTDILGAWDLAFGLVVDWGRNNARIGAGGDNMMMNRPIVSIRDSKAFRHC